MSWFQHSPTAPCETATCTLQRWLVEHSSVLLTTVEHRCTYLFVSHSDSLCSGILYSGCCCNCPMSHLPTQLGLQNALPKTIITCMCDVVIVDTVLMLCHHYLQKILCIGSLLFARTCTVFNKDIIASHIKYCTPVKIVYSNNLALKNECTLQQACNSGHCGRDACEWSGMSSR